MLFKTQMGSYKELHSDDLDIDQVPRFKETLLFATVFSPNYFVNSFLYHLLLKEVKNRPHVHASILLTTHFVSHQFLQGTQILLIRLFHVNLQVST